MQQTGLVLEGGGMRALYTAGILDAFLDHDICFDRCFAVSAGACSAASYLAKQRTRFYYATTRFMDDPRYFGFSNLFSHGSLFGTDFLFSEVADYLEPLDYQGYQTRKADMIAVVTNCMTGRSEYHRVRNLWTQRALVRASSSLPFMSEIVWYQNRPLLDGGLSDPVPIQLARHCGCNKNVLLLTREKGYRKKPASTLLLSLLQRRYRDFPNLVQAMAVRHIVYNRTMEEIERLEEAGEVFVFRPQKPIELSRFEQDKEKATKVYHRGMRDAVQKLSDLRAFLKKTPSL